MTKIFIMSFLLLLLAGCTNTIEIHGNHNRIDITGARNIAEQPSISMF